MALDTELIYSAPETVVAMESFSVTGWLWYYATPTTRYPLAGKTISLWTRQWVDGEPITRKVGDKTTDSFGKVIWTVTLTRGTHELWIRFIGDETYNPCSSTVFTIVSVGQESYITVDSPPPADIGVGEPFHIEGELRAHPDPTRDPMTGPTLELYEDWALVKKSTVGAEFRRGTIDPIYGRWRFSAPAFQTIGTHNLEVKFLGDETYEPSSSGVLEVVVRESEVVPTIENVTVPTKVEPLEPWSGYFHLCNRGVGTGNVRAVISGDVTGETPTIVMEPGACQTVAIGGVGPSIFTIRTGV